jgi:RNA polymerase sigma-70 factor, ECF subfamily
MTDAPEITGSGSQPSSGTSRSLLERVRADDAAAWDRLVSLYAPLVLYWCRGRGLQDADAADVFQEVFLAVATHLGDFHKNHPGDTFRGWLRTITSNKILDHFRRRRRDPGGVGGSEAQDRLAILAAPFMPEEASVADDQAERGLFYRALEFVRGEFEPKTWQAFWLTAVEDRLASEVADMLGMSAGAVRVAKSRVLHRLREELGDLVEQREVR